MDYEKKFDEMTKSVCEFTDAVAREIDSQNLNYLLKDKALDMGFCIKMESACFEYVYVNGGNDLTVRFDSDDRSIRDYPLHNLPFFTRLQIGLVCKKVLEMKQSYEVSFSCTNKDLKGTLVVKAFDGDEAKEIAENELLDCFGYDFIVTDFKRKEENK